MALYSHSVGFAVIRIRIYSVFSQWFAVMLDSHSVGFAVIRHLHASISFLQWFAVMLYSHSVDFNIVFVIRIYSLFRNDSQSCYIRIPLVLTLFSLFASIRFFLFFSAMILSHVIFAFRWFHSDSSFASISFSQWFAVMLYSYSVGFNIVFVIRIYSLFNNNNNNNILFNGGLHWLLNIVFFPMALDI
jgi:hypothetical protein